MKFIDYINETSPSSQLAKDDSGFRKPQDTLRYNEPAIQTFVNAMADPEKNNKAVIDLLLRKRLNIDEIRYQDTIYDNLLNISYMEMPENRKLQKATGKITTGPSFFGFYPEGSPYTKEASKYGSIEIFHQPVIYDEIDKKLLHSIIIHELQHAQDWISPTWKRKMKLLSLSNKESKKVFNEILYAKTLRESRAWAQQLSDLMKSIGDKNKILTILTQSASIKQVTNPEGKTLNVRQEPILSISPTLAGFAEEFLKNYELKENVVSFFAGPLAAFGALTPTSPTIKPVPAIVKQDSSQQEVMAANLIKRIHNALHFRNFLKTA